MDVLWDDRSESAGVKFGDASLIGIPVRLVLAERIGDQMEWKARTAYQGELLPRGGFPRRAGGRRGPFRGPRRRSPPGRHRRRSGRSPV